MPETDLLLTFSRPLEQAGLIFKEGHSEKHLRDIHAMIERSSDEIDEALLMQMIDERGLKSVWQHFEAWRPI